MNLVTPTSAVVMGGLAIAKVGYGTWLKFVWPLLILLAVLIVVRPDGPGPAVTQAPAPYRRHHEEVPHDGDHDGPHRRRRCRPRDPPTGVAHAPDR